MAVTRETRLKRTQGVVASRIEDQVVMMSVENGEYYSFDVVGSRIWDLLEHEMTVAGIVKLLMEEFDVREEECFKDVISFIEQLESKGILSQVS